MAPSTSAKPASLLRNSKYGAHDVEFAVAFLFSHFDFRISIFEFRPSSNVPPAYSSPRKMPDTKLPRNPHRELLSAPLPPTPPPQTPSQSGDPHAAQSQRHAIFPRVVPPLSIHPAALRP